jgi:molybdopterin synthase catalytic subunit
VSSFLTRTPVDLGTLVAEVGDADRGGVVTFLGLVRNHHQGRGVRSLEYSAYEPMADAEAARIVAEAESRWPIRVAMRHRLGSLLIGDIAIAIAAAGAHRAEAFEACRYVIEETKRRLPIWKKEFYEDGSVGWVDGSAARRLGGSVSPLDEALSRPEGS